MLGGQFSSSFLEIGPGYWEYGPDVIANRRDDNAHYRERGHARNRGGNPYGVLRTNRSARRRQRSRVRLTEALSRPLPPRPLPPCTAPLPSPPVSPPASAPPAPAPAPAPEDIDIQIPDPIPSDTEKANHDEGDKECVVCMERKANTVVIVDCGHTSSCNVCLQELQTCPICRTTITKVIRIYGT